MQLEPLRVDGEPWRFLIKAPERNIKGMVF